MKPRKNIVLVLGMHRSGTSVIARSLLCSGIALGENLLEPYPDNVKGFWEDADFKILNQDMLVFLGRSWDTLSAFNDYQINRLLLIFRVRAINLLRAKLASIDLLGIKDPRFSILLPFWKKIFFEENIKVFYILALRNPLSVAESLVKRNKFPYQKSIYLWLQYTLSALNEICHERFLVVSYDLILENPLLQIQRIAVFLGRSNDVNNDEVKNFKELYLSYSLQHSKYNTTSFKYQIFVPRVIRNFYSFLEACSKDQIVGYEKEEIDRFLNDISGLLNYIDECDTKHANVPNIKVFKKINGFR